MGFSQTLSRSFVGLLAIGLFAATSIADEVIIDGKQGSKIAGDFDCSKCPSPSTSMLNLLDGCESSSLTAGELWQFFDSQGVDSLDRLTLCLDVESSGLATSGINSMELKIEDPSNLGSLLTNVSLGDDWLTIPGYDIAPFKPEANLEIELGYDFMQRFSADSTEKISLNVSGAANSQPVVSVQGVDGNGLFSSINSLAIVAFAVFWSLVFISLYRFTKPPVSESELKNKNVSPRERRALSA